MVDLTAVRVRVRLVDGRQIFPDFASLPVVAASGMDWSQYIDVEGEGWFQDNTLGFKDIRGRTTPGTLIDWSSGRNELWHCLVIPEQFAVEAVVFTDVERLTEAQFSEFYSLYYATLFPSTEGDESYLDLLDRRVNAGVESTVNLEAERQNAYNPDSGEVGIQRNLRKTWASFKILRGIVYVEFT